MAQLTDLEKVRRQRQKQRTTSSVLLLVAFAAVVFIATAVVRQAGDVNLKTAYSDIKAGFVKGSGYPVALPGGKILRLDAAGDTMLLLSDTNVYTYNSTGGRMMSMQHGMSNPTLVPSRGTFLVYDRGGNKVSVMSRSAETGTMTSDFLIYSADISDNGNFAIATNADKHLAQVKVYNKSFKEIFGWNSKLPIISVAVSDRSNEMLVGRVDVSDGSYLSSISKLQFSYGEKPIGEAQFSDELLLSVDYKSSGVRVITDKRAVSLSDDLRETGSYTFGDKPIDKFADGPGGRIALVLGDFSKDRERTVVMLDPKMEELCSFTVKHEITDIKIDSKRIYIAGGSSIDTYDFEGNPLSSVAINGVTRLMLEGETLYYTTSLELGTFEIKKLAEASGNSKSGGSSNKDKKSSTREPVPEPKPESEPQPEESVESELKPEEPGGAEPPDAPPDTTSEQSPAQEAPGTESNAEESTPPEAPPSDTPPEEPSSSQPEQAAPGAGEDNNYDDLAPVG